MCFVHASSSWFFCRSCSFSSAISWSSVIFSIAASSFSLYRSVQSACTSFSTSSFSAAIASRFFASAASLSSIFAFMPARRASCADAWSVSCLSNAWNWPYASPHAASPTFTCVNAASNDLIIASIVTSSVWIFCTRSCVA